MDKSDIIFFDYAIFWLIGVIIFFIVEKQLYINIDEKNYSLSFQVFLFCSGLILLIK